MQLLQAQVLLAWLTRTYGRWEATIAGFRSENFFELLVGTIIAHRLDDPSIVLNVLLNDLLSRFLLSYVIQPSLDMHHHSLVDTEHVLVDYFSIERIELVAVVAEDHISQSLRFFFGQSDLWQGLAKVIDFLLLSDFKFLRCFSLQSNGFR